MRRSLVGVMGLCVALGVAVRAEDKKPGDLSDPVEILKKADEAAKNVKSIKYKGAMISEGRVVERYPPAEGSVMMSRPDSTGSRKFKVELTGKVPNTSETRKVTLGSDGETYYVIDAAEKKVYADIDPNVTGSAQRLLNSVVMQEYMHTRPFSDEINGTEHKLHGTERIGEEECYKIELLYTQPQRAVWFFSKSDFLPRRVQRTYLGPDGSAIGSTVQTAMEVQVDVKFPDDAFKLVVPGGYTKSEDFAP